MRGTALAAEVAALIALTEASVQQVCNMGP